MDAVPGMPTYFVFTPNKTTEEYRQELKKYPEYNVPDPNDPTKMMWETFEYELACAELCGSGHWSMKRLVKIVSQQEYDTWIKGQQSYYLSTIRNTEDDPLKGKLLDIEIKQRKQEFTDAFESAVKADSASAKVLQLKYVEFQTGSAALTDLSRYELDNLVAALTKYATLKIEVAGHTDNVGDPAANVSLSQQRAETVTRYLINKGIDAGRLTARGYGDTRPKESNDTEEGRAQNRRTEFAIRS
jgi:cytochrome c oxidase subunit 2